MYKLLLCLRYLRTRYIALACIVSVMLGVATMIVVNSVMAGFSTEMRDRLHNFLADIVIEARSTSGLAKADELLERVDEAAGQYIAASTVSVEIPGMVTFTDPWTGEAYTSPVSLHGIDPRGKAEVGPLKSYLDSYNPVMEDGQIVRPALRDSSEPLGWELTSEGQQHFDSVQEQKAEQLRQWQPPLVEPVPSDPATPDFDDSGQPPVFDSPSAVADASAGSDQGPESTDADAANTVADTPVVQFDPNNPNAGLGGGMSPDILFEDNPAEDIKPQLNDARIYIGEGLVSFFVKNPETGRQQKIMMVQPGDDVIISTITASTPPEVTKFHATVVDSFRSGMSEYDSSVVLMNREALQKNRGMQLENRVSAIQIRLHDYADAPKAMAALEQAFAPGEVTIRTWEEKQGLLLSAVEVETAILNVLLFLIIAVAGFGILAIFYMIVVEKTRDIGILKSLGASSSGVMAIFLSYGLALGIVGSSAGVILGLLFVHYINEIEDVLSWFTGRKVFDEKIYFFFEIPTYVNPWMVISVALGAIGIAVLASILPARRAASLHPVRALRFE